MITLYGKKYTRSAADAVKTLFESDGTANGIYRVAKNGVYLSDLTGQERVFIRKDGFGPVSVSRTENGKRFYLQALASNDEKWVNRPKSYAVMCGEVKSLALSLFAA